MALSAEQQNEIRRSVKAKQKRGSKKGFEHQGSTILELCKQEQKKRNFINKKKAQTQNEAENVIQKTETTKMVIVENPSPFLVKAIKRLAKSSTSRFEWNEMDNGNFAISKVG